MKRSKQMTRRKVLSIMAAAAAAALTDGRCRAESEMHPLRFAVSAETLAGANLTDARAAYKVWLREIYGQLGNAIAEPVPEVFIASKIWFGVSARGRSTVTE
jgi:hypothetical protein